MSFNQKAKIWLGKHRLWAFLAGFALLILVVVPWSVSYLALFSFWGLSASEGQIGDAIGGITAPFIGFFGALLVYYSFQEQIEANRLQLEAMSAQALQASRDRDLGLIAGLYSDITKSLDRVRMEVGFENVSGAEALKRLRQQLQAYPDRGLEFRESTMLEFFAIDLRIIFRKIRSSSLTDDDKRLFLVKMSLYYKLEAYEEMVELIPLITERSAALGQTLREIHDETHAGLVH